FVSFLGVEHGRAADRAEAEPEFRALVTRPHIFRRLAEDLVRRPEGCQRGEDAAGTALAFQAVAQADAARLALHLDAQLAAAARGRPGLHDAASRPCSARALEGARRGRVKAAGSIREQDDLR